MMDEGNLLIDVQQRGGAGGAAGSTASSIWPACRRWSARSRTRRSSDAAELVLDLRGLEFIDSTGLRAILLQDKRSTERGQTFALVRGPEQVQRLMNMTRVDEHLKIIASPEEILL